MDNLMDLKGKLTKIFKVYEVYFEYAFRFLAAFFVFTLLNKELGYFAILGNLGVIVVLSLISSLVPSSVFVFLTGAVALLHLYKLSPVMSLLALMIFLVFYLLYLKFAPEHGMLMVMVPVLMQWNLHYTVPLISGLFFTPFTIVPVGFSFILKRMTELIVEAAATLESEGLDISTVSAAYQSVIDGLIADQEMLLYIAAFAVMIIVTYVFGHMSFDYSWYVGIAVGAAAGMIVLAAGGSALSLSIPLVRAGTGTVLSALITALIQFMYCSLDYARKEYVQFEDDDYYYYVKAIPKTGRIVDEESSEDAGEQTGSSGRKRGTTAAASAAAAKGTGRTGKEASSQGSRRGTAAASESRGKKTRTGARTAQQAEPSARRQSVSAQSTRRTPTSAAARTSYEGTDHTRSLQEPSGSGNSQDTISADTYRTSAADSRAFARPESASKTSILPENGAQSKKSSYADANRTSPYRESSPKNRGFFDDFEDDGYDDSMEDYGADD